MTRREKSRGQGFFRPWDGVERENRRERDVGVSLFHFQGRRFAKGARMHFIHCESGAKFVLLWEMGFFPF